MRMKLIGVAALLCSSLCVAAQPGEAQTATVQVRPAHAWNDPAHRMLLGATRANTRIVAVGAHGIVVLSDDNGKTFRQARSVPVSSTLTDVSFADASHGWAVGQWGVVIATADGGETWKLQRSDLTTDQPLFSVYFSDLRHGWAVGLWSLMLKTDDGGSHWTVVKLPPPPGSSKSDRNLFRIFANKGKTLFVAAEQGLVLRSRDNGTTWDYQKTGGKGSLWAGTATLDGAVYVGGLLGHLYVSRDDGDTWSPIDTGAGSSITDLTTADGRLVGVGLDGLLIEGESNTRNISAKHRQTRDPLTAIVSSGTNVPVLFSKSGVVKGD
ncbi:WD40/YVTN/BNR-like repeat-containing protein [Paraburkholderia phenoliruptrix]|uniref:WD40/YVTN/BNR-like repeat-containing protein n=1 Tax=Paraburkholderia phenoliruptrix TaxID=252970 RepID=UPI0034CFF986